MFLIFLEFSNEKASQPTYGRGSVLLLHDSASAPSLSASIVGGCGKYENNACFKQRKSHNDDSKHYNGYIFIYRIQAKRLASNCRCHPNNFFHAVSVRLLLFPVMIVYSNFYHINLWNIKFYNDIDRNRDRKDEQDLPKNWTLVT